jgi:hypothetical protein
LLELRPIRRQLMLTPSGFDPGAPLPRRTLANVFATGEGRADPARLGAAAVLGGGGALAVVAVRPAWWLAATPLACLGAMGVWGLAALKTHQLDLARRTAPALRWWLRAARALAVLVGALAAVAGAIGAVAALSARW